MGLTLGRNRVASACMDLSDGLADGVRQIAEASGVGIIVDAAALPVDEEARAWFGTGGGDALAKVITRGDDYELLFTSPRRANGRLREASRGADLAVTQIGICTKARDLILRRSSGGAQKDEAIPSGYTHFR